jgi:hypothetical protein
MHHESCCMNTDSGRIGPGNVMLEMEEKQKR